MGDLDIETKDVNPSDVLMGSKTEASDIRELRVGAGSSIFFTDKEGSRWGHTTFDSAKAWIKVDGTAKFVASDGTILMSTGATDGNFINVINTALNTASKTILTDFTFESTDYAGAFKTGNITWSDTTGLVTGGTGGVFNARGIIFANAGTPTITLDATTGNATFAGTLSGASGTFGTITSGTIRGCTVQSTSGDNRVQLSTGDLLEFYYGGARRGYIRSESTTDLTIAANDDVQFSAGGVVKCMVTSGEFRPRVNATYNFGSSSYAWQTGYFRDMHVYNGATLDCYVATSSGGSPTKKLDIEDGIVYDR